MHMIACLYMYKYVNTQKLHEIIKFLIQKAIFSDTKN